MTKKQEIIPLLLKMDAGGRPFPVHAAALWDGEEATLVDTGIPGQLDVIRYALEEHHIPFERVTRILITHQDRDHIGSLPELVEAGGGRIEVLCHETGRPYLEGETPLVKNGTLATPVKVTGTFRDGEILPIAGGLRVIYTPGHTPDHTSFYHESSRTLISGDALTAQDHVLLPFNPNFTSDKEEALRSIEKLLELKIETVIAYHGGVCIGNIRERLLEIVGTMRGA
ncbi:MBL fold metallo-hydrolase [Paenibacillus sp. GD4]|uniref:MBL fold metallo-hydrolase n=1 Tax=Paenibacillus sp. GD4 TaxID=3068890 RepID=UPI002796D716|nr:MBL fold metallo-hydrolase [Paenibacillus sp. GD4]MDQ1914222.1 MBL fold metallo-hydrolase [Paenibacillus sp. GD4]